MRHLARHRLPHQLAVAVAVKVIVLAALWWIFVKGERIDLDVQRVATHLGVSAPQPGVRP